MRHIRASFTFLAMILMFCACGQKAPTWQEQYDLGMRYLSEGNYDGAIIAFNAAIEIDPKQAPAYIGRADARVLSGDAEENLTLAQADYEKAIELDEANTEAYLGLADIYVRRGDYDKAMEILRDGIEKTGENQAITDKLAEVENLADSNADSSKDNESNESATSFVNENLDLRDVSIEYTTAPEAFAGNEGAVGAMVINSTVYGPSNVRDALIGGWFLDESPTQNEINDEIRFMVPIWKEERKSNPWSLDEQLPFRRGQGHPVRPEELGHTAYVVLIGLDENMDAVSYAIVEESIPG